MIYKYLTIIHIAAGSAALLSGLWAAIRPKGSRQHRYAGRIFTLSLVLTCTAALVLSLLKPNPVLMSIGLFSLYLVLSGWYYGKARTESTRTGWVAGFFGMVSAVCLGVQCVAGGSGLSVVLAVFIAFQLWLAYTDFRPVRDTRDRIRRHAGRMGGAYIASVTAFLVVSVDFLPGYVRWLGPTLIGSLLIRHALRQYNKKGAPNPWERPYPKTD